MRQTKTNFDIAELKRQKEGCHVFALRDTKAHDFHRVKIRMMEGHGPESKGLRA